MSFVKNGFTLIELLVVIAVLAIITAITIPSFNGYIESQNLKQAAEQVLSDLRAAQSRSQSGVVPDSGTGVCWGLRIPKTGDLTSYEVGYAEPSGTCGSGSLTTVTKTIKLPGQVTGQTMGTIVFKRISGLPLTGITIRLTNGSSTQDIIVADGGNMYVQ